MKKKAAASGRRQKNARAAANALRHARQEAIGVFPDLIWKNLETAIQSGIELCVRIPVIPSINDGKEDALMFAQKLKSMGIQRVQLLPFHSLGQKKYDTLERKYAIDEQKLHRPEFPANGGVILCTL